MLHVGRFPVVALLGLSLACGSGCVAESDEDVDGSEVAVSSARAALEIHPLDIWARPLRKRDVQITVHKDGQRVQVTTAEAPTVFLRSPGTYAIHLEAPEHEAVDVTVRYDGGTNDESAQLDAAGAKGAFSFGHTPRTIQGRRLPAHVLYLGLAHRWFSAAGRPPRKGNAVELLMDGEEAWANVRSDLVRAKESVLVSTWWWESDFELVRSPIGTSSDQRWKNTILGTLESIPAYKRVLVGEFVGQDTMFHLLNTDAKLRRLARTPDDHFEMMAQANPTRGRFRFEVPAFPFGPRVKASHADAPAFDIDALVESPVPAQNVDLTAVPFGVDVPHASYHQKFMVVDDVAFVGGMNFRHVDWDSSEHRIYDPRRMKFGAWDATRRAVENKSREPDSGPRKDYMVRVEGPAAADVADLFHDRWEHLRSSGARYSNETSSFAVPSDIAEVSGGVDVQVTATMPAPMQESSIAETWFNAVRNAERFIFIEDQYFRMPLIHAALTERMDQVPGLKLVVITKPVPRWSPECVQSYKAGNLFAARYPDRFLSLQLRSFDGDKRKFADMDVHSKMLIVDDHFMSVGSANKNNRGMIYEGELNVAVADPTVAAFRERILQNLLGRRGADDADAWFAELAVLAKQNDRVHSAGGRSGAPRGFVYGLTFPPASACRMQSVGPDVT
jgi:phosphatidylserine/phosphatidylglycerophosphate/cardiolipin synthase-like enzyme